MIIVTMRHIRAAGLCSRGARKFADMHNIDWSKFLAVGFPLEELRKFDDVQAQLVADIAERDNNG